MTSPTTAALADASILIQNRMSDYRSSVYFQLVKEGAYILDHPERA